MWTAGHAPAKGVVETARPGQHSVNILSYPTSVSGENILREARKPSIHYNPLHRYFIKYRDIHKLMLHQAATRADL